MSSKPEKILIGHKLKRLRQSLRISQLEMAQEINISPSYLNLLENNQRPITVNLLFKLGQLYNIDFKEFSDDETGKLTAELNEVFSDPILKSNDVTKRDIKNLANTSPTISSALLKLYDSYIKLKDGESISSKGHTTSFKPTPFETVRKFLEASKNYFPSLEQASLSIRTEAKIEDQSSIYYKLCDYLEKKLNIKVKVLPKSIMEELFSRNDQHRSRILISEALDLPEKTFQISSQIALIKFEDIIDQIISKSNFTDKEEKYLLKITLANYFGTSLIMPYDNFKESANELRYDLEILSTRFATNVDNVCQRLTTLNKKSNSGIPFFYFKFDEAGKIHNRLLSKDLKFPYSPGANSDWSVHQVFKNPGGTFVQISELEDGKKYINISKTVKRPLNSYDENSPLFSIILGCEIRYMEKIIYADKLLQNKVQKISKIELGCRICGMNVCEHKDENQNFSMNFDPSIRFNGLFEFNN